MTESPILTAEHIASLHLQEASLATMRVDDLAEVMHTEALAYVWPWSAGNMRDSLSNGNHCQVLRDSQGKLLGYFIAMPGVDEVHLLNITVTPTAQRQGWARVLLDALLDWARSQQAQCVWLEVRASHARAIEIYHRSGFSRVGLRKDYYPLDGAQREDAIVMSLPL